MTKPSPANIAIIECRADTPDFDECFAIRLEVFVQEQKVPLAEERDTLDGAARHFLARLDNQPVATARLLTLPDGYARIGRVAVLAAYRGSGIGAKLMRHIETITPAHTIILDAQLQAMKFYASLGYQEAGEIFLEAGIAHREMRKNRLFST
ncbi:MAG: hypothetical protein B7Z75_09775 [Acidocella sp. 20-57-95]|nr:MAG: hypothetical protein B7Z75_09775 [Acidocella sp. 20-57-95]OYV58325.1 MAG: hypothetical protein B7Z71_10530 [Acidocella sp. 21-58-7]HQT65004.1 GNAT family N-acetyltransferase [Acidocella sp.]HQU04013.1 GNAT family N-acetyltransferase [Acidocella sp.]